MISKPLVLPFVLIRFCIQTRNVDARTNFFLFPISTQKITSVSLNKRDFLLKFHFIHIQGVLELYFFHCAGRHKITWVSRISIWICKPRKLMNSCALQNFLLCITQSTGDWWNATSFPPTQWRVESEMFSKCTERLFRHLLNGELNYWRRNNFGTIEFYSLHLSHERKIPT
jgi:hypothetical protein